MHMREPVVRDRLEPIRTRSELRSPVQFVPGVQQIPALIPDCGFDPLSSMILTDLRRFAETQEDRIRSCPGPVQIAEYV